MPQMAPISWLILFIFFSTSLLMFNFMNYFLPTLNTPRHHTTLPRTLPLNWKW